MGKCIARGDIPYVEINVCDGCIHKDVCGDKDYLTENVCSGKVQGDIKHIAELMKAEEQGLLVWLPCKVGDTAFVLEVENQDGGEERIFEGEVISFFLADGQVYATIGNMEYDCWFSEVASRLSDIGVDWFLTREEAEKALKEANRNG